MLSWNHQSLDLKVECQIACSTDVYQKFLSSNHIFFYFCCVLSLVLRELEERKLRQGKDSLLRQIELDQKQIELEERRLEAEKEQAEKKLEAEHRRISLEEKRLLWEKKRSEAETDTKYKVQMAILVQSAVSNGYKLEDIKKIMAMVTKM